MHPVVLTIIIAVVAYIISVFWAHRYWSNYINKNGIDLCPEEAQVLIPMLFMWFFYWDGIEVILKHADRVKNEEEKEDTNRICGGVAGT